MLAFGRDLLSPLLNLGWFVGLPGRLLVHRAAVSGRAVVAGPRSDRAERAGARRPGGRGAERHRRDLLPARRGRGRAERLGGAGGEGRGGARRPGRCSSSASRPGSRPGPSSTSCCPRRCSSSGWSRSRRGATVARACAPPAWRRWPAAATGTCATSSTAATRCPGSTTSARSRCRRPSRRSAAAKPTASSATSTDGTVWSDWFLPGLHDGLWIVWPLLGAAALAGLVLCLLRVARFRRPHGGKDPRLTGRWRCRPGRPRRRALAWLVAPTSASGPDGMPRGFESGLRYLAPALVLGLALLPATPLAARVASPARRARSSFVAA